MAKEINLDKLLKMTYDLEENFLQICFCKNQLDKDNLYNYPNKHITFDDNKELFGFTKLRMWDQYGDKFRGVCIAFSKDKLKSKNTAFDDLIIKDIEYLYFSELKEKKTGNIQRRYLQQVGMETYIHAIKQMTIQSLYCKHNDYEGENELRIGTFFSKEKCTPLKTNDELILDKEIMLDITECIEAIFVSSFANKKQKEELQKYAEAIKVKLIEITWKNNDLEISEYNTDEYYELLKNL